MIVHLHEAGKGASELVYDIGTNFLVAGASEKWSSTRGKRLAPRVA